MSAIFYDNSSDSLTLTDDIGYELWVSVDMTDASNVWAYNFMLDWNPSVLQLTYVYSGDPDLGEAPECSTMYSGLSESLRDQITGTIDGGISCVRLDSNPTNQSAFGMVWLGFTIIGYGTSDIIISDGDVRNPAGQSSTATTNSAFLTVASSETLYTLSVASDHALIPIGSDPNSVPQPYVDTNGITQHVSGTEIPCTAPNIAYENNLKNWTCIGWTGTGSVSPTGEGNSTTITITEDSSITWLWEQVAIPTSTPSSSPTPTPSPTSTPEPVSLSVSSAHGVPSPGAGVHEYADGDFVTASLTAATTVIDGVSYNSVTENGMIFVCTGWTGTGSVPVSGSGVSTTFTITQDSSITWNWVPLMYTIDIKTDRGGQGLNANSSAFGPEEEVTIIAQLKSSFGGVAVTQKSVAFNIYLNDKQVASRIAVTNNEGIAIASYRLPWYDVDPTSAFGLVKINSTVNVGDVALSDSCVFLYDYVLETANIKITNNNGEVNPTYGPHFSRYSGPSVNVNVTVSNLNWSAVADQQTSFYISGTLYDFHNVPISYQLLPQAINNQITPTTIPYDTVNATFTLNLPIPSYAFVGPATLYINIHTDNPAVGGLPLCPEKSVILMIDAEP
ncbi:MAG: hypothetical protein NWF04_01070 [Candidatus Bathyarchaeota archaeon]|nr:hypothetical protein [Candidatus Bathyarchaeota archaeon]